VRDTPHVRGDLLVRVPVLLVGLALFAAGIVALLESRLGLSPWDVLHQGISRHTPLTFGEANIVVSAVVLAGAWALGARVGFGTVANAVLVGSLVQAFGSVDAVEELAHDPLAVRIVLLAAGLGLMGVGTALYLGAGLGAGPRDSLMVVGAQRTRFRIGAVRGALELSALAAGVALGGTFGVGTVAFAIGIGPAVELSFWLLDRSPLGLGGVEGSVEPPDDRGAKLARRGEVVEVAGTAEDARTDVFVEIADEPPDQEAHLA
jgi:uncharacterized membrane protein YczE